MTNKPTKENMSMDELLAAISAISKKLLADPTLNPDEKDKLDRLSFAADLMGIAEKNNEL